MYLVLVTCIFKFSPMLPISHILEISDQPSSIRCSTTWSFQILSWHWSFQKFLKKMNLVFDVVYHWQLFRYCFMSFPLHLSLSRSSFHCYWSSQSKGKRQAPWENMEPWQPWPSTSFHVCATCSRKRTITVILKEYQGRNSSCWFCPQ